MTACPSCTYTAEDREADELIVTAKDTIVRLADLVVFQGTMTAEEAAEAIQQTAGELNHLLTQIMGLGQRRSVNRLFADAVSVNLDDYGVLYPGQS